jgi:hypothetical protein
VTHPNETQSGFSQYPEEWAEQFGLRDEANAIVAFAFRNGPLETLHAGKKSSLIDDDQLSRITDAEMRELMLNACEMVEKLLRMKVEDPEEYSEFIKNYGYMYCKRWKR